MYATKSGERLSLPAALFGTLGVLTVVGWVGIAASIAVVAAMSKVALLGQENTSQNLINIGWTVLTSSVVLAVLLSWLAHMQSIEVTVLSRVDATTVPRAAVQSSWGIATMCLMGSLFLSAMYTKYIGSTSLWIVLLLVSVASTVVGAWCAARSARELWRISRKAMVTPYLFVDGINCTRSPNPADSRVWKKLGTDWINPNSVYRMDTALRYADAADTRSSTFAIVGRWTPLPFVGFITTAFIWIADANRPTIAVAVPLTLLGVALAGVIVERRGTRLDRLAGEYRERAEEILSKAPGSGARISLWSERRRRQRRSVRRPMERI